MTTKRKAADPRIARFVINPHIPGSKEWLDVRRQGLGASEVPAILGMSKYQSPVDVWLEKTGRFQGARTDSPQAKVGRHAESMIAGLYAAEANQMLVDVPSIRHSTLSFLFASGDRMAVSSSKESRDPASWLFPVEIKNRGGMPRGWGEPGTDQVPDDIAVQVHVQLECYEMKHAVIAVLLGGNDFRTYNIFRDAAVSGPLLEAIEAWHRQYIVGDVQPPLTGADSVHEWLAQRFQQKNRDIVKYEAAHPLTDKMRNLREVRRSLDHLDEEKSKLEAEFKEAIGEGGGIETPAGKITWLQNKDSEKTDWKAATAELVLALDQHAGGEGERIVAKHTETKPGARVLRFTAREEE